MSNAISMIATLFSFIFLWCCPSICYSALIQPQNSLQLVNSPKYKISKERNFSYITPCGFKYNETTHKTKCLEVKGGRWRYRFNLTEDGFLHLKNDSRSSTYIAPGQFCRTGRHSSSAKLCPSTDSSNFIWRKCCPKNQLVVDVDRTIESHYSCATSSQPFQQGKQSFTTTRTRIDDELNFSCPAGYTLKKFSTDTCGEQSMSRFRPSPNGTIQYEKATGVFLRKSEWKTVDLSKNLYCVDGVMERISSCSNTNNVAGSGGVTAPNGNIFQRNQEPIQRYNVHVGSGGRNVKINTVGNEAINKDKSDSKGSFYTKCDNSGGGNNDANDKENTRDSILFVCLKDDNYSPEASSDDVLYKTNILAFIWSLTCPLLLAAALANCCIIQKNVHGCILTCYLLSMCFLNVLSVIVIVEIGSGESVKGCRPLDFLIKFTYMSTLCWMSSINFGLHKTFRYTLPQPVGYRRFLSSVIFSLGFPVISVTVCYYVAYLSIDRRCGDFAYCVLFSPITIPFYSVPMLLLVLGNFAIFLKTSYTITTLRKEADDVLQRQAQDHLKSFALFAKLFLLTGGIWLLRVVLFILQVKGLYLSWYGVMLEIVFSVPEAIFPMIVFHHSEFIKWCWNKAPIISSLIYKINPFFHVPTSK